MHLANIILLVTLLLSVATPSQSQYWYAKRSHGHSINEKNSRLNDKGFSLAAPLFCWIDPVEPSVGIQSIYTFNKKLSVALEGNYIYGWAYETNHWRGWRLRPEIRFRNVFGSRTLIDGSAHYLAIQAIIKSIDKPALFEEKTLTPAGNSFSRLYTGKVTKLISGVNVVYGNELFVFGSRHLYMDPYIGLGLRNKQINQPGAEREPANRAFTLNDLDHTGWYPSLLLGCRLGWKFK